MTTNRLLPLSRRALIAHRIRMWLIGRDVVALAAVSSIVGLAVLRALWLAVAGVLPTMGAAQVQPTLAPIIMVATAVPPPMPTADPLAAQLAQQAVQIAILQQQAEQLRAELAQSQGQQVIYVPAQVAPAAAPTPAPPVLETHAADPMPPIAPPEQPARAEQPQSVGGSGKMPAIDFNQQQPASETQPADADTAARWCAAAASAGQARCKP